MCHWNYPFIHPDSEAIVPVLVMSRPSAVSACAVVEGESRFTTHCRFCVALSLPLFRNNLVRISVMKEMMKSCGNGKKNLHLNGGRILSTKVSLV